MTVRSASVLQASYFFVAFVFVLSVCGFLKFTRSEDFSEWKFDEARFSERLIQDWLLQDVSSEEDRISFFDGWSNARRAEVVEKILTQLEELDESATILRARLSGLVSDSESSIESWRALYRDACMSRRKARLSTAMELAPRFVYTKHYVMGASHYAYTEDVSDEAYNDTSCNKRPGGQLCLATFMPDGTIVNEVLVETSEGTIRDPDVSWDGKKILFSMRSSQTEDDFHIYEYDVEKKVTRQITFGLGVADIEPIYLPNDDLLFVSTRCGQITDCWWTEVANLYTCDAHGRFLRRVSVDQVTVNYPKLLDDGRVVYTRWDYNDRGHIYVQPLFQMNTDGTGQTEFYGNNSYFPTVIMHPRGIPGSDKVVGILGGHHTYQHGKLALIDRSKGTQGNSGVTLVAPIRETPEVVVDRYGQEGELFQYPYPITEEELLTSYLPEGSNERTYAIPFGVYWFNLDGERELLTFDPAISCGQPIALVSREKPTLRTSQVDLTQDSGFYYVQDVYEGPGLAGIKRGTVKKLRVVALEFRPIGIGWNWNFGEAGNSIVTTPISVGGGTWDVKRVLGETTVEEDGSAFFEVPALTPVYFQLLDGNGDVVQTMRSWSTLQPGETFGCVGCHEPKAASIGNASTALGSTTLALRKGATKLEPVLFPGEGRMQNAGFSYLRDVQPILDRYCVDCHTGGTGTNGERKPFSLLANDMETPAPDDDYLKIVREQKRTFAESYIRLTQRGNNKNEYTHWPGIQDRPSILPPYYLGAANSRLIEMFRGKDGVPGGQDEAHRNVNIDEKSLRTLAMWIDLLVPYCGDYLEANRWTREERAWYEYYLAKRIRNAKIVSDNIAKKIEADATGREFSLDEFEQFDMGGPKAREAFCRAFFTRVLPTRCAKTGAKNVYRNLALNPDDIQCDREQTLEYPHAFSNSEYAYLYSCSARNAIDGNASTSWTPNRRTDAWLNVDFGCEVELDKVVVRFSDEVDALNTSFKAKLVLNDEKIIEIELQPTNAPQTFHFEPTRVVRVKLSDVASIDGSVKSYSVAEFEAWGVSL